MVIQLNLSSTAILGTEEGSHCREVETRVNAWTARQKLLPLYCGGRCGEVAVTKGSTVQITWMSHFFRRINFGAKRQSWIFLEQKGRFQLQPPGNKISKLLVSLLNDVCCLLWIELSLSPVRWIFGGQKITSECLKNQSTVDAPILKWTFCAHSVFFRLKLTNYQQRLEDFTTKPPLQTYSNPGWKGPVGKLCKVAPISFFWTPNGLN